MHISECIDIDQITLVEPLFSDLAYEGSEEPVFSISADIGRILIDQDENPLLFALCSEEQKWYGCSTHLRSPSEKLIEKFEEIECEIFQEERDTFSDAVREYYSLRLMNESEQAFDDYNPDRYSSVERLIKEISIDLDGERCLDCCCGSGIGSLAMRSAGLIPLAFDNDDSLLSRGLAEKRLLPQHTMWIDARLARHYLEGQVPLACGFMLGEIRDFNADLWKEITYGICELADRIILTVVTEKEGEMVRDWAISTGKKVDLFEQDADPIYDRWVIMSR